MDTSRPVRKAVEQAARLAGDSLFNLIKPSRRAESVRYENVAKMDDLLSCMRPSIFWMYEPRTVQIQSELLFPELSNEHIRSEHASKGPAPTGVGLACLPDAIVSGSSLVGTARTVYRLGPAAPLYVDNELNDLRGDDSPVGRRKLVRRKKRLVPGLSAVVTHWNADVYGHWLLECMPKLLLLRRIAANLPSFRIAIPASSSRWITAWIRHVLPDTAIETYDPAREYLQCERLLLPTPLMYSIHYFHPELVSLIEELRGLSPGATDSSNLYVSRVVQSHFRELSNRSEIEAIAAEEGLRIVKPENHSIAEQVALFSSARLVVGEFGSSMHNTLFSPRETDVLCLNWINVLQSRIAHLNGQRVGYLLPSDGVPVKFERDGLRRDYHIDPQAFRKCIRSLLASG